VGVGVKGSFTSLGSLEMGGNGVVRAAAGRGRGEVDKVNWVWVHRGVRFLTPIGVSRSSGSFGVVVLDWDRGMRISYLGGRNVKCWEKVCVKSKGMW